MTAAGDQAHGAEGLSGIDAPTLYKISVLLVGVVRALQIAFGLPRDDAAHVTTAAGHRSPCNVGICSHCRLPGDGVT